MSATKVAHAGKRGNICVGNNVSATMCRQQCVRNNVSSFARALSSCGSTKPSGSADYFDNVMTKFIVSNRTDALRKLKDRNATLLLIGI